MPNRVTIPGLPSAWRGGDFPSDTSRSAPARSTPLNNALIGSTSRGFASMKNGVFSAVFDNVIEGKRAVPGQRAADFLDMRYGIAARDANL